MGPVPIAAMYGAFHGLMNVALAANVTRVRAKSSIFLGTGDNPELLLAARRHGNHSEYVALFLVLLAFAELSHGSAAVLHGAGALFTVARLSHAVGIGDKPSGARALGALLTWAAIATAGVYALIASMKGM
jgi:uncharacterized membrane protein YecN with MAPEG domain